MRIGMLKMLGIAAVAGALSLAGSGCGKQSGDGAMEKTGSAVDKAAEKTKDGVGKAVEKTGEALGKAGDAVEKTGKDMKK